MSTSDTPKLSRRAVLMIYQCALDAGMTEEAFFGGVGYGANSCPEWIAWEDGALFHDRLAAFAGTDERLRELGFSIFKAPAAIMLVRVLGLFSDLSSILMRMNAFIMRTFFPGLLFQTLLDSKGGKASATITIPEPHRSCRPFFILSATAYEALFQQLKVSYRSFTFEVSDRTATYTFTLPARRSLSERLRKMYQVIVGAEFAVEQLAENEEELRRRLEIVEAAHAEAESLRIKEAEARKVAVQALEVRQRFLAVMSHELRTPLNHIIGAATLLKDEPLAEENREMVGIIDEAGHHLLHLIELILDFTGTGELSMEAATDREVTAVLEPILEKARYACATKGLAFDYAPLSTDPTVSLYPEHLSRILTLLLDNAVKFTEAGAVRLQVAMPSNERLSFTIQDSGCGIPALWEQRVFEPFVAADDSQTRAAGGIGLGLTIARKLAREIGGDVRLLQTSPNGSTFLVDLPVPRHPMIGDGLPD